MELTMSGSNAPAPIVLIRGFGGLNVSDERKVAYQGFNDGTVYPQKRGENYIYEGLILRLLKSRWAYQDATNVVGYYPMDVEHMPPSVPPELAGLDPGFFYNSRIVIDPAMARHLLLSVPDLNRTLWVFRYYDLNERNFAWYGAALLRLIDFIAALGKLQQGSAPKVNLIAHSMGGLLVRQAVQISYPERHQAAADHINKIVTLGTPHQGISFQVVQHWLNFGAGEEISMFNPERQADPREPLSFRHFGEHFPLERLLAVVGTNYRTYDVGAASLLNRLFPVAGEFGLNYNRSDGLVKQSYAQIPGAHRTFIHKCHGGADSLVTCRETYEIASRFFFGNTHASLRLVSANIKRGKDLFGKSEFFFGVAVKPRAVDFDLFFQSPEAENCYGPFSETDLSSPAGPPAFDWAGDGRLILETMLDTGAILNDASNPAKDLVLRFDIYVGERDLYGLSFSDNVVFRKQYYVRAMLTGPLRLFQYADESFTGAGAAGDSGVEMARVGDEWLLQVGGTGFDGTLGIRLRSVGAGQNQAAA